MGLNIKNPEVERLAAEVARLGNVTKTEAIRLALAEQRQRLLARGGKSTKQERLGAFLRRRVWPEIPEKLLRRRITKKDKEAILGYGPGGF